MRAILIGMLHLVLGVLTFGDSARMINTPFDMFVHTLLPLRFFILTAAIHGFWSGSRQAARTLQPA